MTDKEKIKDKISKLLAKARGTEHENEANLFMAKALKMMEEHQLAEWEVSQDVRNDPVDGEVLYAATASAPTWMRHLWAALGTLYGCKTVRSLKVGMHAGRLQEYFDLYFIGPESARVTTKLMQPFVLAQVRAAGRKLKEQGYDGSVDALTRRVANALVPRIYAIAADVKREQAREQSEAQLKLSSGRSLVVVEAIDARISEMFGALSKGKSGKRNTFGAARDAANKINVHANQVATGSNALRIAGR